MEFFASRTNTRSISWSVQIGWIGGFIGIVGIVVDVVVVVVVFVVVVVVVVGFFTIGSGVVSGVSMSVQTSVST